MDLVRGANPSWGDKLAQTACGRGGGTRCTPAASSTSRPTTIDEALAVLDRYGGDGKVLAGGQSLIPLMKLRFAAPPALVDINRIPGLDELGSTRTAGSGSARSSGTRRWSAPSCCAAATACSATRRRRSPTRSCATSARSAARSRTPTRRATGARPCSPRARRVVTREPGRRADDPAGRVLPRARSRPCSRRTRSSPGSACPSPGVGVKAAPYLKLERKVGDFATVGVAVHVSFSDGGTVDARRYRADRGRRRRTSGRARPRTRSRGRTLDDDAIREAAAARRGGGRAVRRPPRQRRVQAPHGRASSPSAGCARPRRPPRDEPTSGVPTAASRSRRSWASTRSRRSPASSAARAAARP